MGEQRRRDPVIRLEGIRKSYNVGSPTEVEVLHGVDLAIGEAEFVALIGPSGSGKSTLLNILGLLERASAGDYRLVGESVVRFDDAQLTARRNRTIGFVFQFHHLLPAFSALDNVTMPVLIREGRVDATARARGEALLDAVGLSHAHDRKPAQLSGGMQQRVAIARALSNDPRIVLADEPTGNLDTKSADEVFELMRRFNRERNTAFLVVTHDPRLAARCDRTIDLRDGVIYSDAATPGSRDREGHRSLR
ncbi:MAG: ABC transporter ATP-binding protein [Lautropia sp.]